MCPSGRRRSYLSVRPAARRSDGVGRRRPRLDRRKRRRRRLDRGLRQTGRLADYIEGAFVGQKVHPFGFRLGLNKTWRSRWYSNRDYAKLLHEDLALRQNLKKRFAHAGVSKIET